MHFIPSPSSGALKIGPLAFNAYGLCIAIGALAAVWLTSRRWVALGGRADAVTRISTWAIPAGIVGARLYHVLTDWKSFRGRWIDVVKVWEGGLGIWGGVFLGTIVGLLFGRREKLSLAALLHAAAPAIPLAQGIGRWGNWFNTELFGRPTTLPWALKVPLIKRPADLRSFATFHPTFLYESIWDLLIALTIVSASGWILKRFRLGGAFAVYVAAYTFGRFFIERIRVDGASRVGSWRINEVVSLVVFMLAVLTLLACRRRSEDPAINASGLATRSTRTSDVNDSDETGKANSDEARPGIDEYDGDDDGRSDSDRVSDRNLRR